MKTDLENHELYDKLFPAKGQLRLESDIQNFENHCFSVNDPLNKHRLFLRVYELKDKFQYLINQNSKKKQTCEIYLAVSLKNSAGSTLFALRLVKS